VTHAAWGPGVVWGLAIVTALLFFAALVAHELAHAAVARRRGLPVHSITLFALGGVAQIEKEATDASTEFWMGIAGPIASALIGGACLGLAWMVGWPLWTEPATPLLAMLVWLGYINLALALFKFQFVLPFVAILLMRRRWRLLPGFAATSTGLLLVSFFLVGWEGLAGYVAFFREISMKLAYGTIHPQLMPNLRGAVATLLPDPVPAAVTFSVVVILSGLLLILAAWRWPSTESSEEARFDLAFALGVVATVLASYHLNAHDLALLLLPVALVARHLAQTRGQSGWARRGLLLAVFSLYYPALYFVPEDSTLPHSLVWVLLLFVVSLESELGKTRAPASA